MVKLPGPEGKLVDAEEVAIKESTEKWNIYKLADGTTLRMKLVAAQVFRLKDIYNKDGEPFYRIKSQNVAVAEVPDSLRKKSQ